jgi:hypothetical protein
MIQTRGVNVPCASDSHAKLARDSSYYPTVVNPGGGGPPNQDGAPAAEGKELRAQG